MKKIIYVSEIPKQFENYFEFVKDKLNWFYNEYCFTCQIEVKFLKSNKINVFEIADSMVKHLSTKKHELIITNELLKTIHFDGGRYFCVTIYHEFEHINDYIKMMQTNRFKFNLGLRNLKNYKEKYISIGYDFWTEVNSYYQSLEFAKENNIKCEKITFGTLVKYYAKTVELGKKYCDKKDLTMKEAKRYVNFVDSFIYLCAKYMASLYASHSRLPRERIEKNKDYKKVYLILAKIHFVLARQLKCNYGYKSYENLLMLGKCICEKIRWKIFNVGLTIENGIVRSIY